MEEHITHKVTCTEDGCHQHTPFTEEMKEMTCNCGHKMREHSMGVEHIVCNTCGHADTCGGCSCGHEAKKHIMEEVSDSE